MPAGIRRWFHALGRYISLWHKLCSRGLRGEAVTPTWLVVVVVMVEPLELLRSTSSVPFVPSVLVE